jgi:8-oxo-dGTP pyrophosphatase MutT (NUDIX family)
MPLRNCPIFFQIQPESGASFRVLVEPLASEDGVQSALEKDAPQFGLDWRGFATWRETAFRRQYLKRPNNSTGVRCNGLRRGFGEDCWIIEGTKLRYYDMIAREQSVDLIAPGVLPDMRRLLEGASWDEGGLDPSDVRESATRYSMWVSVTGLVLTKDDYFVLQRRSSAVAAGVGSIAASLNGGVDWSADCDDLQMAALRELQEELGLCPAFHILASPAVPVPPRDRPFIGAAYNLRYGRDLNFYCCFASSLFSSEVSELRKTLFFERSRARDAWEVENLVFLKRDCVTVSAIESGEIDRVLPNRARHLVGALYSWAKYSEKT